MAAELVTGAARRRRERRLRQFLRHERLSVAMALAECTHHAAPRGQKKARAGGVEREENFEPRLLDPPLPQTAATVGYVAAAEPLLVVPSLAGGDSVDGTALRFLVKKALERQKEEEKEKARKLKEAQDKADLELAKRDPWWAQHLADKKVKELRYGNPSSASSSKRKRKKRRKRRTPRISSLPGRARRRYRQYDEICADNYFYFRFKLNGKGRSEQWEVFLYCDKTIKVDRDSAELLPWGVPLPDIGGVCFGSSLFLDTKHTIYELSLPSERGLLCLYVVWWWRFPS